MQTKIKFPATRLMITLFISMLSIILLQNYSVNNSTSFIFDVACVLIGFLIIFLFYAPSIIIKKRTNLDFLSFAHLKTPSAVVFISAFYCIYFVYAITYFLYIYSDMFVKKLNSEANIYVVAFLVLGATVYAAYKGVNAITRYSIFVFVFAIISFLLVFLSNVTNLNFENFSINFTGNSKCLINNLSYFLIPSFSAVIFAGVSGYTKKFKIRQVAISLVFTALIFILSLFFIRFCLGGYAYQQPYQFFLLSKTAHLGVVSGIEGFFLALVTTTVFITISLMLTCITKSTGKTGNIWIILMFALIIVIFFICTVEFESIKSILLNHMILNIMSFIGAVAIPSIYLLI